MMNQFPHGMGRRNRMRKSLFGRDTFKDLLHRVPVPCFSMRVQNSSSAMCLHSVFVRNNGWEKVRASRINEAAFGTERLYPVSRRRHALPWLVSHRQND